MQLYAVQIMLVIIGEEVVSSSESVVEMLIVALWGVMPCDLIGSLPMFWRDM
jgi:hypothetical protein